jgi:hypothetical protein
MSFYDSGLGDRLVNHDLFPNGIKEFLKEEELLLAKASSSCDLLVEVGSMHGRYLEWTLAHGKAYIGVDIVERYISLGQDRANRLGLGALQCQFLLGDAKSLDSMLKPEITGAGTRTILLFFPFNSFGNMQSAISVVQSLKRSGLPFMISTYLTTPRANECRKQYYAACQYKGLEEVNDYRGIVFKSKDGLCTMAYHHDYLNGIFNAAGLQVETTQFGEIGIAYASHSLFAG